MNAPYWWLRSCQCIPLLGLSLSLCLLSSDHQSSWFSKSPASILVQGLEHVVFCLNTIDPTCCELICAHSWPPKKSVFEVQSSISQNVTLFGNKICYVVNQVKIRSFGGPNLIQQMSLGKKREKFGHRNRQREREEWCEETEEDGTLQAKECLRARKPKANPSLVPSESRHPGFRLLEFRAVKCPFSVVLSHSVCGTLLWQSLLTNMLISVSCLLSILQAQLVVIQHLTKVPLWQRPDYTKNNY